MNKSHVLALFEYNYWANGRVLSAAAGLSPDAFVRPAGLSHGSIRGALVHVYGTERVWRQRCQEGISPPALPAEGKYESAVALAADWTDEEMAMRGYLASLTDAGLASPVRYVNTKGVPFEEPLWQILAHVVNHGSQFRAEAGVALARVGHSPGDLDLILFFRERTG